MENGARKLQIICPQESNSPHPYCPHGPALLFRLGDYEEGYYACAAHRDKRVCNLHLPATQVTPARRDKRFDMNLAIATYKAHRLKLKNMQDGEARHYCHRCNFPLLPSELPTHRGHELVRNLSVSHMRDPTEWLRPLDDDKVQAQYFFDKKALQFFENCLRQLKINKVVCIGAPRLHAHLRAHCSDEINSYLLDFDRRLFYFFGDDNFAWYNMCNNHFFDAKQLAYFNKFLQLENENERLLLFTDPPFGCRTEPIAATLQQLTLSYNSINKLFHQPVAIFWIFPYFAEHYIHERMPQLRMCDYKVNYTNHDAYTDHGGKCRKLGSPVRVFTNVPLEELRLPVTEEYKYCVPCRRYTALENQHCGPCGTCPSKNGSSYRHCGRCGCCVKPNYVHCDRCRRCTQSDAHDCLAFQAKQRCWICLQRGHTERQCIAWFKASRRTMPTNAHEPVICCLLCGHKGHNERTCQQRNKYLEESKFLGVTQIKFR